MRWKRAAILGALVAGAASVAVAQGGNRLGFGVHYWRTVDDIDVAHVEEDGLAWVVSYQIAFSSLLRVEAALEIMPEEYGGAGHEVFSPQGYVVLGSGLYGGLGVGALFSGGDLSDPFYVLRLGLVVELLPPLSLDINANYLFTEFDDIKTVDDDIGSDTVTLGLAIRVDL